MSISQPAPAACIELEGVRVNNLKHVVGHTLWMEQAKGIAVTLLVREARYWGSVLPPEEAALVHRQLLAHHVRVLYTTELAELLPEVGGRAGVFYHADAGGVVAFLPAYF